MSASFSTFNVNSFFWFVILSFIFSIVLIYLHLFKLDYILLFKFPKIFFKASYLILDDLSSEKALSVTDLIPELMMKKTLEIILHSFKSLDFYVIVNHLL